MNQYPKNYYKRYKNFNHARLKRLILEEIKPFINSRLEGKANLIIDIGCGIGRLTSVFKDYTKSVVGLDISLDAIKLIDRKDKGIFFIEGNALFIPVKSGVCDICVCIHVVEHIKDVSLLLSEIYRIAADKSKVIFITPNKKWTRFSLPFLKDKTHVKEFTIDELEKAVSVYFSVEKIKPVSMFTSFGLLNPVMNAFFKPDIYISAVKRSAGTSQALAGFEKSLADSSGHGVLPQAGAIRHEIILPFATVYSSFLCRLSLCHLTETRCNPLRTFAKIFLMCLRPQPAAGRARIGVERRTPRWGVQASFRKPARAWETSNGEK